MKRLMFRWQLMEEATPPDGGSGGGGTPATPPATTPPANGNQPPTTTPPVDGSDPKPFLGNQQPPANGNQPPNNQQPPANGNQPSNNQQPTDEDYAKALVKDEKLLGDDKAITLDAELYKACIPAMKKYGVTPEAANALANALAKAQIDDAKARMQSRLDYFEKMKQESLKTYTQADFEKINAGIDRWFKPGGVMNNVIRNSELGADPEFLALMHHLGKAAAEDGAPGAASGSGGTGGDPNSFAGISKLWK